MRSSGQNLCGLDRADVHNVAFTPSGDNAPAENLRAKPRPAQIYVCNPLPLLIGHLDERHDGLDACIIYKNVDMTELAPNLLEHRFHCDAI